jgi:acyl carrier protein
MSDSLELLKFQEALKNSFHEIAPEVDLSKINPELSLRDQVDLDSMDYLNLLMKLHQRLGVSISVNDYAKVSTLKDLSLLLENEFQSKCSVRLE